MPTCRIAACGRADRGTTRLPKVCANLSQFTADHAVGAIRKHSERLIPCGILASDSQLLTDGPQLSLLLESRDRHSGQRHPERNCHFLASIRLIYGPVHQHYEGETASATEKKSDDSQFCPHLVDVEEDPGLIYGPRKYHPLAGKFH
jgi:hypothetical protein